MNCGTRLCQAVFVGLSLVAGPNLAIASATQETWNIATVTQVDSGLSIHYSDTAIATDSTGGVHISYRNPSAYLSYATNSNGSWQTNTLLIDWRGSGRENDMVFDSAERLHISSSSRDGSGENLYHLYQDAAGIWRQELVYSAGSVGMENSIAIDANDTLHISHWAWSANALHYSTGQTSSWTTSNLTSASWDRTAIAVDTAGNHHVIYRLNGQLWHADANGTTLIASVTNTSPSGPSVAIDTNGYLHVSYGNSAALRYATNTAGFWVTESIDSNAAPGRHHSIAIDAASNAHVSYRDEVLDALLYAHNLSGDWTSQVIDNSGEDVGYSNSIVIDTDAALHISYRWHGLDASGTINSLRYATTDLCRGDDASGDSDIDGVCENLDLCQGDDVTGDSDDDGICDDVDLCHGNDATEDSDNDGVCNDSDLCLGNDATGDSDNDDVCDAIDNCPVDANTDQADLDLDGLGDVCDLCQGPSGIGPVVSAQGSIDFLAGLMDAYHDRFPVYDDVSSAGNHFPFFGITASDVSAILVKGSSTDNPHSGATSVRCEFIDTPLPNWGGLYFMNGVLPDGALAPSANWGTEPDAGIAIPNATALTFWARGENGGEQIKFFMGGVGHPGQPFPDSSPKHPTSGLDVTLTTNWQQFTIPLDGVDLSYVLGGFGWVTNDFDNPGGAVFHLDDIQYELSPEGQTARLDEPRFIQSYKTLPLQPDPTDANKDDDIDFVFRNLAFTYDNALALLAFLADGSDDGLRRARLVGDAFVYASLNDRFFDDGRIRTAYAAGDLTLPPGWTPNGRIGTAAIPGFFDEASGEFFEVEQGDIDVGNNSWVMTALLALFGRTDDSSYLDAARRIGDFIRTCRNDSGTYQGFQGGIDDPEVSPTRNLWASGEHNLDVYAAFSLMEELTGEASWLVDATHARIFVETLWDPTLGCYFAGTADPETRNEVYNQLPLDIQTWSVLALPDVLTLHPGVLGCIETNHRALHGGFAGYDFNTDQDGAWFEGTAQAAVAYLEAGRPDLAAPIQEELRCIQSTPPFGDGSGLFAATREGLTTGFDFKYFQRFHIATASWNVFAQLGFNPYYYYQLPAMDLSITKTDGQTEATPGEALTYTLTVSNAGPSDAVEASVVDLFPATLTGVSWTCDASGGGTCGNAAGSGDINETVDLPAGTSVTLTATATINPDTIGRLDNTATITVAADSNDPVAGNNSATDSDVLSPKADLRITKSNGSDEVVTGQPVIYLIIVTNDGPSTVNGAVVTDAFPATVSQVSWTCDEAGGGICTSAFGSGDISEPVTLPVGASVSFTATGTVDPSATDLSNTATVAAPTGTSDPVPANNSATDSDIVTSLLFGDGFESGDTSAWSASSR